MTQCSGCGCSLSWPYKTCSACAQEFFKQLNPLAGPIQKVSQCSKCGKLEMCSEHDYQWLCSRCKPAETVRKSVQDGQVQKVDKAIDQPPKQPRITEYKPPEPSSNESDRVSERLEPIKPRKKSPTLLRWYDSDMRQRVLAFRIQEAIAAGSIGLTALKQKLHASRYRDWQSAFDWLTAAGVIEVQGKVVVLVKPVSLRLPPRSRRPRRKQTNRPRRLPTEWFDKHRQVYGGHWKSDSRLT
jgi:ribosomal protein S27AE